MTTISDPSAMTPDDPRWLSWFMQQRRFDRLSRKAQTGASLITDFAAGIYEMGYPGQRRGSYELSDIVKVSRSTGGGRFNSSGVYEWVGNDAPRLDYHPVTLQPLGLLIEEQRTNLLLNSAKLATQSRTVTAAEHTLTFYGTGSVTLSGAATGTLVGTGIYDRVSLKFTPSAGSLTITVSGSCTKGQLEAGAFPTSYIPTEASQVTRAADVASVNTLSPWYNASEGALVVRFVLGQPGVSTLNQHAAAFSDGGFNNYLAIRKQSNTTIRGQSVVAGAVQADITSGAAAASTMKVAFSYKADSFALSQNGSVAVTDLTGTLPVVDRLDIGRLSGAGQYLNGTIASLEYYPRVIDVQQASA